MTEFERRNEWDVGSWPEMFALVQQMQMLVFTSEPGPEMNLMVFTVASQASGCRHCQAHGSFGLHHMVGVGVDKVRALWSFESSPLFSDRERAALRFALAAGSTPNAVTADHHAQIRAHFADVEARTLLAVVAMSGFMNRFNDSLATVTDDAARQWASEHLSEIGWAIGKHTGTPAEQRPDLVARRQPVAPGASVTNENHSKGNP
jgi:alkylhydroperoxidase family enzyme